jgi:cell division protein FtsL
MHKFINALMVIVVLVSGFMLYTLEHATRGTERSIAKLEGGIVSEREQIKFLHAEWSSLVRPDRLQKLAAEHLILETIKSTQIVPESELAARVPAEQQIKLEAAGSDPIGDILEKMQ